MMRGPYDSSLYFETPQRTTDKKHQRPSKFQSSHPMIPPKRPFPRYIKSTTLPRHLLLTRTQIPPPPQSSPPPHFSSQTTTHKHYTASAAQPAPSSNTDSQPRRTRYSRGGVGQPRPSTPLLAPSQVNKHTKAGRKHTLLLFFAARFSHRPPGARPASPCSRWLWLLMSPTACSTLHDSCVMESMSISLGRRRSAPGSDEGPDW